MAWLILCVLFLISAMATGIQANPAAGGHSAENPRLFETATQPANASAGGLQEAASGSGYYYDKHRYRSDSYGYGGYPSYGGYGNDYGSGYQTQSCYGQPPGSFGNPTYNCQSFSICQSDGRLDVMDCPAYLRFNNYLGVCDWPYKVDSYCNPLYKDEYYSPSYGYGKSSYEKPAYYEKPSYAPSYAPQKYYGGYSAPSYGSDYSNSYASKPSYPSYGYSASPAYNNYYKKY